MSLDWTNLYGNFQEDLGEAKVVGQEYSGADKEAAAEIFRRGEVWPDEEKAG